MHHIVAATTNPAKISAITRAFGDIFGVTTCHIESVAVDSGVAAQPLTNAETRTGARQRVMNARQVRPEADFWVAIEAGIEAEDAFAWIVVENRHQRGESRSASFTLPPVVLQGIREGNELGDEMARLTGINQVKHQGGAIGFFTNGLLSRASVYHQALILALIPFHHQLWQSDDGSPPC